MYEYKTSENSIHAVMPMKFDSSAIVELSIVTDFGHPYVRAYYSSNPWLANNLEKLDMELEVDGKIIAADEVIMYAEWFHTTIDINPNECCLMLGDKLKIDTAGMENYGFSVSMTKNYSSPKTLPEKVTVHLSSQATNGRTDTSFVFTLKGMKDTRSIRFH